MTVSANASLSSLSRMLTTQLYCAIWIDTVSIWYGKLVKDGWLLVLFLLLLLPAVCL